MARVLEAQGKSAQAQAALEATIKRYPKYLPAYNDLAESQIRQRKVGAAIQTLKRGLAVDADDPVLLNNLGMCWLLLGNHAQARQSFESAVAAAPGDARYQSNLALATAMLGEYDESLEMYKQVVSAGQAHYNVAVACEARNDAARADVEYAAARELDSSLKPQPRGVVEE
jgi:tetratricopeptide (TPR) repeat protein